MLRRVALVRTNVSKECIVSIITVTRIGELGTALAITSNRSTLRGNTMSVLTRATLRNIPKDGILLCTYSSFHRYVFQNVLSLVYFLNVMKFACENSMPYVHMRVLKSIFESANMGFEALTAVSMKNAVLCDVMPRDCCNNRHFGGTYHLLHQDEKNQRTRHNFSSN
jgi:hypothetical protein